MGLALGEEKLIAGLCGAVILYFQCNLRKLLKEICCSGFWSFCCSVSNDGFTCGSICRAWVLSASAFIGVIVGVSAGTPTNTAAGASLSAAANASASTFVGIAASTSAGVAASISANVFADIAADTSAGTSAWAAVGAAAGAATDVFVGAFAEDKHNYNWDTYDSVFASITAGRGRSCNPVSIDTSARRGRGCIEGVFDWSSHNDQAQIDGDSFASEGGEQISTDIIIKSIIVLAYVCKLKK